MNMYTWVGEENGWSSAWEDLLTFVQGSSSLLGEVELHFLIPNAKIIVHSFRCFNLKLISQYKNNLLSFFRNYNKKISLMKL